MAHKRHGRGGHRKKRNKSAPRLTDGQKHFLKETGELHPSELKDSVRQYTKVKDEPISKKHVPVEESSESEEEENAFQQLMSSIGQGASANAYKSSEEEDEEDSDDAEDDGGSKMNDKASDDDDDDDDDETEEDGKDENDSDDIEDDEESKIGDDSSVVDDDDDDDDNNGHCDIDILKDDAAGTDDDDGGDDDDDDEDIDDESSDSQDMVQQKNHKNLCAKDKEKKGVSVDKQQKGKKRKLETALAEDEVELNEDEEDVSRDSDPFAIHFERDLSDTDAETLSPDCAWDKRELKVANVGKAILLSKNWNLLSKMETTNFKDLRKLKVKQTLCNQVGETNRTMVQPPTLKAADLSPLQQGLFSLLNAYQDVSFSERTHSNGEEVRLVYCLHALNHALKTRTRVVSHNTKMKSKQKIDTDDYRDQGLTRPKVLMVLPFRESALRVVNIMSSLLAPAEQVMVSSKKRFKSEYGAEDEDNYRKGLKPEDFESLFTGNNDDHFRLGISVSKRSLKLYMPFYQSDIILASPLGLRTIIGAEGEKDRDYDFLSSIELLILDQADVFLMQNWDHILHLFKHLHLQPKESHDVDFSRVRMWTLSGWSHLYRQSLIFSAAPTPEINAVFNKYCHNYAGKVQLQREPGDGVICQIITQTPQTFQKISCTSFTQLADSRFDFFIKKLVPHHRDPVMNRTLVYIPSYFDFVRVRNHFRKEGINFVHMSEYATDKGISRVRCDFFHGKAQFLLYTERLHFYRRFRVRGIKHIIFYELPTYPHFYTEMCNMIKDPKRGIENKAATCTTIYSKYDAQKLAEVVGAERTAIMLNSEKSVHMFITGETS
ncbi:U3 small nucleolar RNA-associated protein 25 homolog isoform X2 [Haliotis rufescens]|uniref:U3 small nucleolar RNA-associated protein 25 homolog isoform X2 n=1 Tax=Haliotis rufescens TaxID=6454 RepID=UPI00201FA294|nr:U3 small nucleolar RNA-associated protein 25 homolog isoform X2 [Haliotis rufescens]